MINLVRVALLVLGGILPFAARADAGAAKPFAEGIISTPQSFSCVFSPDGSTAYFARFNPELKCPVIMRSSFVGGTWSEPSPLPFSHYGDFDLGMAPDGKRLFFSSARSMPGKPQSDLPGFAAPDIWYVDISGSTYSEPKAVGAGSDGAWTNLTVFVVGTSVAADGTLYACKRDLVSGAPARLKRIKLESGVYSRVEDLGDMINGSKGGEDPFVEPQQRYLIFASNRADPSGNLWVSYRADEEWTELQNLGVQVSDAFCPVVTSDRKSLVFSRMGKGIFSMPLSETRIRREMVN